MTQIKRIYHPYYKWEEVKYGMYDSIGKRNKNTLISKVVRFFNNYELMKMYMEKVIEEFKFSCEHNLSNPNINRIAFIGQCSLALYDRIPQEITMQAWNFLDLKTQERANKFAQKQIDRWEKCQRDN